MTMISTSTSTWTTERGRIGKKDLGSARKQTRTFETGLDVRNAFHSTRLLCDHVSVIDMANDDYGVRLTL